jgi:uncharacterized protein
MRTIALGIALIVAGGAPLPLASQTPPPIIDMHLHTHHPPWIPAGAAAICRPEPCEGRGAATATEEESLRRVLAEMRRYNVVKALLSGSDPDELERWVNAAPERFLPSPWLEEPGQPPVEHLREAYDSGRYVAMGEIATQLSGVGPNDPALADYFELAAELDLPVLIHTEGIGPRVPGFRSDKGNPLLLEDVLVRYPDLRIYVENAGYPFLGEMIAMMNQYPQLYGDLSTITWILPRSAFYAYLRGLIDAGLGKRLMFGSDQMRWPEAIGWAVEAIEEAPFLSEEQKRDIFYENAARFLRIDEGAQTPSAPSPR